ncbi:hypothetical protein ABZ656_57130 [Streptomyces sp. NPDC007095]|uniref:hypothetical protein n=1 Tax=Streptomyces sp. NPDC007095 TaxID=3154482 RepID=UPI0033E8E7D7
MVERAEVWAAVLGRPAWPSHWAEGIRHIQQPVLEALGMVWSAWDTAWVDGRAVAQEWAAVHGHLLAPTARGT